MEKGNDMERRAQVIKLVGGDQALVSVKRIHACTGKCESCHGCAGPNDLIEAVAENPVGAAPGDQVALSSSRAIMGYAAAVYLLPTLFFIGGYFLPFPWEGARIAASFTGLAAGVLLCRWLAKRKKDHIQLEITRILNAEDDLQ